MISAHTKFILIIGHPISHSLSPYLHNSAYAQMGLENEYVYLASDVDPRNVGSVIDAMRNMTHFHGLTCTVPHKTEVLAHIDVIDPIAHSIGAVNTVVKRDSTLIGYNTDWLGIVEPLRMRTPLAGKRALVLGTGGAARAALYGLIHESCVVTVAHRSYIKAQELANEFGCMSTRLETLDVASYDIIFNATPVGMHPLETQSPLPHTQFQTHHIVFDAVYTPRETTLLAHARLSGATCIEGWEMLLHQAIPQFELYTGTHAPFEIMKHIASSTP